MMVAMHRSSRLVASLTAVAVAACVAGCASSSHPKPLSARVLAARLGCTGVTGPGAGMPAGVRSTVTCYLPDKAGGPGGVATVIITTFSSAHIQKLWMQTVAETRNAEEQAATGNLWTVSVFALNAVTEIGTVRKRLG
jgi:hypothetical protein